MKPPGCRVLCSPVQTGRSCGGSWTAPKEPSERLHPALNVKGAPASPAPAPSWDPLSSTGKPVTGRRGASQSPASLIPECEAPLECGSLW